MSTDYRLDEEVSIKKFKKAVEKAGLTVHKEETQPNGNIHICVTDGQSYLWFYTYDGKVGNASRYGNNYNADDDILSPVCDALGTGFLSEHDDGYFEDEDEEEDEEVKVVDITFKK